MRIMITGGAGFIGSHIAEAYLRDGHEVSVLDDLSSGSRANVARGARFYAMNVADERVAGVMKEVRPEILNHHAAQIDVAKSFENPSVHMTGEIGGFLNLMESGRRNGLKKIIFASSAAVYAEMAELPAEEDHRTDPESPYGMGKLMIEHLLRYYERSCGIHWASLRYANVYGPRQRARGEACVVAAFLEKMVAGGQPLIHGSGRQTRDFIHVSDIAEANRIALRDSAQGVYNVGTGHETEINKVFQILRRLTESRCPERHGPARLTDVERNAISAERLRREFGWDPAIGIEDGIRATVEWFSKNSA